MFPNKTVLEKMWSDTQSGRFRTFDGLRKLAQVQHWLKNDLDNKYDAIFIDEAQDFDPIMLEILLRDTTIPKIFVGDPMQQIYTWRGCVNAFDCMPTNAFVIEFYTTFRIGNPACDMIRNMFDGCWMVSATDQLTHLHHEDDKAYISGSRVYLFRKWRNLLEKATILDKIWIHGFEKQADTMRKLHAKLCLAPLSDDERKAFSDDLPNFLLSISTEDLEGIIDSIENNIVDVQDADCHMYTIHSYKGLEADIVCVFNDIDPIEERNLLYVALTRGKNETYLENVKDDD